MPPAAAPAAEPSTAPAATPCSSIAACSSRRQLDAFIRAHRRELRLTEEEELLLHLRRRRLALQQLVSLPSGAGCSTRLDGEDGRPRTPIKVCILGDSARGVAALLGYEMEGVPLPVGTMEVVVGVAPSASPWVSYEPPRATRAVVQLWSPDDASVSKPLRSACFQGAEAFVIVVAATAAAAAIGRDVSLRLAEIRAWRELTGAAAADGAPRAALPPIVLAGVRPEGGSDADSGIDSPLAAALRAAAAHGGSGAAVAATATLTDEQARQLARALGLASYVPPPRPAGTAAAAAASPRLRTPPPPPPPQPLPPQPAPPPPSPPTEGCASPEAPYLDYEEFDEEAYQEYRPTGGRASPPRRGSPPSRGVPRPHRTSSGSAGGLTGIAMGPEGGSKRHLSAVS